MVKIYSPRQPLCLTCKMQCARRFTRRRQITPPIICPSTTPPKRVKTKKNLHTSDNQAKNQFDNRLKTTVHKFTANESQSWHLLHKSPQLVSNPTLYEATLATHTPCGPIPSNTRLSNHAATRQHNFEQAVVYALHLWPALTLAVANGWGGPDSVEKRDMFAGAIVELFSEFTDATAPDGGSTLSGSTAAAASTTSNAAVEADTEDVETVLLQVMVDEFEVNVDDDSALEVAQQIVRARTQCAAGQFDETIALAERFAKLKGGGGGGVGSLFQKAEDPDQDTDGDSDDGEDDDDDEGSDVDMGDAPAPKEKAEPQVDEDGFTMVTKKKR